MEFFNDGDLCTVIYNPFQVFVTHFSKSDFFFFFFTFLYCECYHLVSYTLFPFKVIQVIYILHHLKNKNQSETKS